MSGKLGSGIRVLLVLIAAAAFIHGCAPSESKVYRSAAPAPPPDEWPQPTTQPRHLSRDAFYDVPGKVPPQPGALLRQERLLDRVMPVGAQAWRIQYTTTFSDGTPAIAVATVLAASQPARIPRPVITWAHSTVGLVQNCMPSLITHPFAGVPALSEAIAEGWVIVATDYATAGPDGPHPYAIGEGEARSALDAVRAARLIPDLKLDDRTVVWGHSQGGHTALWTGIIAPRYAPDVKVLGTVPIAPATDMARIMTLHGTNEKVTALASFLAVAYSHFYPDVAFDDVVRADAREIVRELANECTDPNSTRRSEIAGQLNGIPPVPDFSAGAFGRRLRQNIPVGRIKVPVLIVQGLTDNVAFPFVTDDYVKERCAAGQPLEYWIFAKADHQSIVEPRSPLTPGIMQWTRDRFDGSPAPNVCTLRAFQFGDH